VKHHTKDKGDLGVAKAHADLVSEGFTVLFPATEHAPIDLVAYGAGEFCASALLSCALSRAPGVDQPRRVSRPSAREAALPKALPRRNSYPESRV
jgi:hypothetical protein